jgi:hypothetical protein
MRDEVHQERQLGQSEPQVCVVREALSVMMKIIAPKAILSH